MAKRTAAILAVTAVMVHCIIGCCARCVSACDCIPIDQCPASCCPCCDMHESHVEIDRCCQPATTCTPAMEITDSDAHDECDCTGCGKHKCAFILSESPSDFLTQTLLSSPSTPTTWDALSLPMTKPQEPNKVRFLDSASPRPQAKLRLHLSLGILTI